MNSPTLTFTMQSIRRDHILQFLKYACVGVVNTIVTLVVIYVCKSGYDVNEWLSNSIGYVAGMINSFIWNKVWVFDSHGKAVVKEMVKFFSGFLVCYGLQLLVTWLLSRMFGDLLIEIGTFTLSGYGIATLLGMVFYTLVNFIYNRLVTFKK